MIINRHINYVAYTDSSFTANILYFNIRSMSLSFFFLFFFTVTKQRDPETGQQSLLFQVSVFGWNPYVKSVDLIYFCCFRKILKQSKIKSQPKRDAIKLSNLFKLLFRLALKCLVPPLTAETAVKRYFPASWISTHSKLAIFFFVSVSNSCLIQRHMLGSLFTDISYLWRSLEHGKSLVSTAWYYSTRLDSLLVPGTFLDFVFHCR